MRVQNNKAIKPTTALAACLLVGQALADTDIRSERVQFEPGAFGTTIARTITGRETIDYLVGARAGQTLSVTLKTEHSANYFNVIPPDADNEAVFIGSTEGSSYEGKLDLDGDWKIRVYLMRSAARRNEPASYELSIGVTGDPDPAAARVANEFGPRDWDARGDLDCARGDRPMQTAACPFKVIRYREGATIFVLAPITGAQRILYFESGKWSTDDAEPIQANRRSDLWSLLVAGEAYEIPDAVLFGG
jgi:hypothetical protein